jgi:hypothetical protein
MWEIGMTKVQALLPDVRNAEVPTSNDTAAEAEIQNNAVCSIERV